MGLGETGKQESGENYIMRSLIICTPHEYCSGDQIEKNEMDGACSTYGERRSVYRVLVVKREGKWLLGRPRLSGTIILKWIFRKWDVGIWTGSG